jgi:hypothetical protein
MKKARDIPPPGGCLPRRPIDPNAKLYDCFPSKFLRVTFRDNDFYWSLKNAVPLVLERLTWHKRPDNEPLFDINYVEEAMRSGFAAVASGIQRIWPDEIYPPPPPTYFEKVHVSYVDTMDWGDTDHDTVFVDCYGGEIY